MAAARSDSASRRPSETQSSEAAGGGDVGEWGVERPDGLLGRPGGCGLGRGKHCEPD